MVEFEDETPTGLDREASLISFGGSSQSEDEDPSLESGVARKQSVTRKDFCASYDHYASAGFAFPITFKIEGVCIDVQFTRPMLDSLYTSHIGQAWRIHNAVETRLEVLIREKKVKLQLEKKAKRRALQEKKLSAFRSRDQSIIEDLKRQLEEVKACKELTTPLAKKKKSSLVPIPESGEDERANTDAE